MKIDQFKKHITDIKNNIALLTKHEKLLTKNGCILAYAHFKTGTNKMYLRGPVDSATGKRSFTYIGVDEKKQQIALAKIERYHSRESVRAAICKYNNELDECMRNLEYLLDDFVFLADTVSDGIDELINK